MTFCLIGAWVYYYGLEAEKAQNEPATILLDYLPDEGTIGESLLFGRNFISTYANILPILFLSVVVICL